MNKENTEKLLTAFPKTYPKINPQCAINEGDKTPTFRSRDPKMEKVLKAAKEAGIKPLEIDVSFKFRCRDGWFNLIWEMSKKIESELIEMEKAGCSKIPSAVQVKEKFGLLRVYMTDYPKSVKDTIHEVVVRSATTG